MVRRSGKSQPVGGQYGAWASDLYTFITRPLADVVGKATAEGLHGLGLVDIRDLLYHLPRRYLNGTDTTVLSKVTPGEQIAVIARIGQITRPHSTSTRQATRPGGHSERLEVQLTDGSGQMRITFFGRSRYLDTWERRLSRGYKGLFVGKVSVFNHELQMTNPTFVIFDQNGNMLDRADGKREVLASQVTRSGMIGIYPASSKLTTWMIADSVDIVLSMMRGIADPMPAEVRAALGVEEFTWACRAAHQPKTPDESERGRRRLLVEEALSLQVMMARRRALLAKQATIQIEEHDDGLLAAFDAKLPFQLTTGQQQVSAEIFADLGGDIPMRRLLQGEVGSGKTVVALRAMLATVDAGYQAALLAPTEVLAEQHFRSITNLMGELATPNSLQAPPCATMIHRLTGSTTKTQRAEVLADLADGSAGIVVGTHALLGDRVDFAALGLVVIDEQHRFGVEQRSMLHQKAAWTPHSLVLTATPIPRSVAMTIFGDLEVSTLREPPPGRQEVQTTVVDLQRHPEWLARVWQRVTEEVAESRQVFVVCPRIDQGEGLGTSAIGLAMELSTGPLKQLRLGLLHADLAAEAKAQVMADFVAGRIDVLVATTVIEVGVDIPNASMMVIMDADHFGVSQLHQLRGRIGRGEHPGLCLLVTSRGDQQTIAERLAAVAASNDGFALAETDLIHRREGDVLGNEQSGRHRVLRMLDVTVEPELIEAVRDVADELVSADAAENNPWLWDLSQVIMRRAARDQAETF